MGDEGRDSAESRYEILFTVNAMRLLVVVRDNNVDELRVCRAHFSMIDVPPLVDTWNLRCRTWQTRRRGSQRPLDNAEKPP